MEPFEQLRDDIGDIWLHVAFESRVKLFVGIIPGKRTLDNLRSLTHTVNVKSDGHVPLFTTDEYSAYLDALLWEYGQLARIDRSGLIGRPSQYSYLIPTASLLHGQVQKTRKDGRIDGVETNLNIGTERDLESVLTDSPCSTIINTSLVERSHLHERLNNRRLTRKTLGFSKADYIHEAQISLCLGYYHFVRPHMSLRLPSEGPTRWTHRTPAMAANITDHIWSMPELLTFPNCYHSLQ